MKDIHTYLTALPATTIRDLIDQVNSADIQKEDIVTILKENETFILLYYASSEE